MSSLHKNLMRAIWVCLVAAFLAVVTAHAQEPKIQISHLDKLGDKADKVIDVTVTAEVIKLAMSAFSDKRSADEKKIKELLEPLKGIYVKRFEFETEGSYSKDDAEMIRSQLNGPGWQHIANVRSKRQGSFDVVIMSEGSVIKGIAVLAVEPKALTVVNVVGPLDLAKLRDLEGKFGIPRLGLEASSDDKDQDKNETEKKPPQKR